MHRNIPDIHPAAVVVAFQSNMHNRRIRSKMNARFPKTVNELYTLVDKCARVEEGRRLPGEEYDIDVDSEDDNNAMNQKKKNKKHNKKRKDKVVLAVEGSSTPSTSKTTKTEAPVKEVAV